MPKIVPRVMALISRGAINWRQRDSNGYLLHLLMMSPDILGTIQINISF